MAIQLPGDSELPFSIPTTGVDAAGNAVPLSGPVTITLSDSTIAQVIQPDPLTPTQANSAVLRPLRLGTTQLIFSVSSTNHMALSLTLEVEVVAGAIVAISQPTLGNLRPFNSSGPG